MTKSTAQAQIDLRFKQLKLKLFSKQLFQSMNTKQTEYTQAFVEKKKAIWKLIDQVAEITTKPEVETELSKQLLENLPTEISCNQK